MISTPATLQASDLYLSSLLAAVLIIEKQDAVFIRKIRKRLQDILKIIKNERLLTLSKIKILVRQLFFDIINNLIVFTLSLNIQFVRFMFYYFKYLIKRLQFLYHNYTSGEISAVVFFRFVLMLLIDMVKTIGLPFGFLYLFEVLCDLINLNLSSHLKELRSLYLLIVWALLICANGLILIIFRYFRISTVWVGFITRTFSRRILTRFIKIWLKSYRLNRLNSRLVPEVLVPKPKRNLRLQLNINFVISTQKIPEDNFTIETFYFQKQDAIGSN